MIEESVKTVTQGTSIANETAQALSQIVTSVDRMTELIGSIAAASNEQAEGIAQINEGLKQVDQVTQQNTASAEESAAAAEELSNQASALQDLMNRFTLDAPASAPGGLDGVSPELLAAVQAYLSGQGGGASQAPDPAAAMMAALSGGFDRY